MVVVVCVPTFLSFTERRRKRGPSRSLRLDAYGITHTLRAGSAAPSVPSSNTEGQDHPTPHLPKTLAPHPACKGVREFLIGQAARDGSDVVR